MHIPFATQDYKPRQFNESLVAKSPIILREPYLPADRNYDIIHGGSRTQSVSSIPQTTKNARDNLKPYPISRALFQEKSTDFRIKKWKYV